MLISLVTALIGILVGRVFNAKKIDAIYEKLIRLEERFGHVDKVYRNQEEIFDRLNEAESAIAVIKSKLKIK